MSNSNNVALCEECGVKTCWFDEARDEYSPFCSNTCRFLNQSHYEDESVQPTQPVAQVEPMYGPVPFPMPFSGPVYNPTQAVHNEPKCRICNNAAYYDGRNHAPGCCRSHTYEALSQGHMRPE